ncbi:MAG: DUF2125 domain-containing protein [Alphaproteobacteria bacterium]|nr:DUF2125 domain-containing protein [Alphaproteobacteria bacterium]
MTKMRTFMGLIIAAVIIYAGLWHTTGFKAEKETAAMFAKWRDKGLRVEHGKIKLSGFPYRMVITVDGLHVRTRDDGLNFGAESVMAVSHLWTPGHWVADARNITLKAADEAIVAKDGTLRGSYRLHDNGQTMIVIDSGSTDDFELLKAPGLESPTTLKSWQLFFRTEAEHEANASGLYEDRFLDFKITAEGNSNKFETIGGIMGPIVKDWTANQLGAWRDAGGLLELDNFSLTSTDGSITGNASLTLDERFQLLGSASLKVSAPEAAASSLDALGLGKLGASIKATGEADLSLMMQMGSLSLDGQEILPLKPLIKD